MSDVNIKLVAQGESEPQEKQPPSYLLNVEVLNDLKHAIQEAKDTKCSAVKADQE
jgi:hypothetical protein